jgi:hypothetical protein
MHAVTLTYANVTRRWKIGVDYGYITLDRIRVTGVTHALHTRFQWIY